MVIIIFSGITAAALAVYFIRAHNRAKPAKPSAES